MNDQTDQIIEAFKANMGELIQGHKEQHEARMDRLKAMSTDPKLEANH